MVRGSSNGTAAANVTNATAGATASARASASHGTTAKAKTKSSGKKTAAASGKQPSASLLTVPAGWKLTFDPSFSGTQLGAGTWATCYDWATNPSVRCTNNPTKEKEWYIPSQVNVGGGTLNLVAKQESTSGLSSSGAAKTYTCRSGMVTSKPGFNFTYGLIQISGTSSPTWPTTARRPARARVRCRSSPSRCISRSTFDGQVSTCGETGEELAL